MYSRMVLAALTAVACAGRVSPKSDTSPLSDWTGCYALSADSLPPMHRSTDWGLFASYPLPDSLALETGLAGIRESDERRQYKLRASYPSSIRRASTMAFSWTPITADSIDALVWADGFRALSLELSRRGGGLVGSATWGTDDMGAPTPSAAIRAVSVPCSETARKWPLR